MKKVFALARALLPRSWYVGFRDAYRDSRTRRIKDKIFAHKPIEVLAGPFQGMRFIPKGCFGAYLPLVMGGYEQELLGVVEEIIAGRYDLIIDVGAAEGYYAVGLARAIPGARIIAYDIDRRARELCAELAEKNEVADRVEIRTEATPEGLSALVTGNCLVIADCEGYEETLLDPAEFPRLSDCDVLVEFHDFIREGVAARIEAKLAATHSCRIIHAESRSPDDVLAVAPFLSRSEARFACDEFRPDGMKWGWFTRHRNLPQNSSRVAP